MSTEHIIVGATGIGYLIVGVLQWTKGETANGMIWTGYAFAQVGLWLNIKRVTHEVHNCRCDFDCLLRSRSHRFRGYALVALH